MPERRPLMTCLRLRPPADTVALSRRVFADPNTLFSPLLPVVTKDGVYVLDMAAKIDATADYICKAKWGDVEFPPPFGREAYPEVREPWGASAACRSFVWGPACTAGVALRQTVRTSQALIGLL